MGPWCKKHQEVKGLERSLGDSHRFLCSIKPRSAIEKFTDTSLPHTIIAEKQP